jgi:serine/threonine-protein phosphatase PP1 catalytic subunit
LLYILKILFPQRLYLLRGNHECDSVCAAYGFKGDCLRYLSDALYNEFLDSFLRLPYAAVVNSRYFCVHGGISPLLKTVATIAQLPKPAPADQQLQKDLLWSDPDADSKKFRYSDRGSGFFFGEKSLDTFLDANGLALLIRSHEPQREGFRWSLPRCLTVFSTTNHQGMGNTGAVVVVSAGGEPEIHTSRPIAKGEKWRRKVTVPDWLMLAIGGTNEDLGGGENAIDRMKENADGVMG